jgi:hypothetical protein
MASEEDRRVERLLSRGASGGDRADALWARVDAGLSRRKAARARAWWASLLMVPTVAAAALLLWPRTAEWTARGGAEGPPVQLRATCGAEGPACRVGQPVSLMVVSHAVADVRVVITLEQQGREVPLGAALLLPAGGEVPVPTQVVPEQTDRAGLVLHARLEADAGHGDGGVHHAVLRLEVLP